MSKKPKQKFEPKAKPVKFANLAVFSLIAPEAKEIKLAGDFNGWKPQTMRKCNDEQSTWEILVNLKSGKYQYKFVVDGDWKHDPANVETVQNKMGTLNSVIRVK